MIITAKKAAMFGLDARIALAIYSIISVIILAYTLHHFKQIDYNRFFSDADTISKAIILYIRDTKSSIFNTVNQADPLDTKELNTFKNLQEVTNVIAPYNSLWKGPYLRTNYQTDPTLGVTFRLAKLSNSLSTTCNDSPSNPCYIFLKLKEVDINHCNAIETLAANKNLTKIQKANVTATNCDLFVKLTSDYN